MRKLLIVLFSLVSLSQAAEKIDLTQKMGVGIALHGYKWIAGDEYPYPVFFVPIHISKYVVEPSIYYLKSETGGGWQRPDVQEEYILGLGVFRRIDFERTFFAIGGRFGYGKLNSYSEGLNEQIIQYDDHVKTFIGPTIGSAYFFSPHFSVGLEASYLWLETRAKFRNHDSYSDYWQSEELKTNVILRFYI